MKLTEREADVLHWLLEGLANKEIASTLQISEQRVKNHLRAIYKKRGVTTARQIYARELGPVRAREDKI